MKSLRPAQPAPTTSSPAAPGACRRRRRLPAAALACALVLAAGACTLRIGPETPDALPSASQAEAQRDALARQTALIASTARAVAQSTGQEEASALQTTTAAQLEALGGVWEPWPSGAPSGYPTASPVATADASAGTQDLVSALTDGVSAARAAALEAQDPRQACLYAALAVSWSVSLEALSPGAVERVPRTPSTLGSPLPGTVLVAYDAARYALEDVSARASGDIRTSNRQEAAKLRAVVDVSLSLGGRDGRRPSYARPAASDGVDADTAWAQQVWTDIAAAEVASIGDGSAVTAPAASLAPAGASASTGPQGRQAALDAAVDAALHARAWGAPAPVLPGLAA